MKTNLNWRTKFLSFLSAGLLASSVLLVSCDKDDADDSEDGRTYTIAGNASGSQVSPPTTSTATGSITGTYNGSTNVLQYAVGWTTLTAVASGVELRGPATIGSNGTLVSALTITTPGTTGVATGSITLTETQEDDLLDGDFYYTILTATNTSGEIRGQVTATVQ